MNMHAHSSVCVHIGFSVMETKDPEWFFFSLVDYKFSKGSRLQRATKAGYWKPTGQDLEIKSGSNKIGTKKTLVYYSGRGRAAKRTNWVISEYRADIAGLPYDVSDPSTVPPLLNSPFYFLFFFHQQALNLCCFVFRTLHV